MASEATFTVPADQFPLGSVFEQHPDVTVELERIIPAQDVVIPYFWVRGTDIEDVESTFTDHPGVENIRLVDSVDDEYLLRAEWAVEYTGVLQTLTETEIALLKATGTSQQWTFEIRGDRRRDIAAFQERCRELEIPITLTELHALRPADPEAESELTGAQQEALALAYRRGYYDSPRETTLEDLGDALDISRQAVASRLRRGTKRVLGRVLPDAEDA